MPPVLLEDEEAVAAAVALRAAAGSIAHMDEAAIGVLAKIDQVMPARLRKRASFAAFRHRLHARRIRHCPR